jgi:hypothetical protein
MTSRELRRRRRGKGKAKKRGRVRGLSGKGERLAGNGGAMLG